MPNPVNSSYLTLQSLLNRKIPGAESAGFDQLSGGYDSAISGGLSSIARRGLMNSGAVPELYTEAGGQYARGAGQAVSAAQAAQNQQIQQVLQQLLGLTGPAEAKFQGDILQRGETTSRIGDIGASLFGQTKQSIFGPASTGFLGTPQDLLFSLIGRTP